ncbi:hypothetical protein K469DRAFT_688614 [Zopfia rhizophila CBS 207.26]|uniref:Uncharacterized protein n=1 Tax=Zopfia rhizophila CBS 207.26 TaxID=1314779 RepID=A0A6A6DY44_9PEZI|nr:hypothetical protein K469DRAFT_688614 [Zopfia rhizophila CBS 207.26]
MAQADEHYTGPLARWFRPQPQQPNVAGAQGDLNTMESNPLYHQRSLRVGVQCWHQKSEWGTVEGVESWAPYLYILFTHQKKPRWANFTVKVEPQPAGAGTDAGATNTRPCLTPDYIFPIELLGGVRLTESKTWGFTISPSGDTGGAKVSVGSLNRGGTRNYDNVIEAMWTVEGHTDRCDDSNSHRQAQWRLGATRSWRVIPRQLRVGLIVKHGNIFPFHFNVQIEGAIHGWLLGDYYFSGHSPNLTVKTDPAQNAGHMIDFTGWAEEMMKSWMSVPGVQISEQPAVDG